jgi:uncharacterized membrane protein YgcG
VSEQKTKSMSVTPVSPWSQPCLYGNSPPTPPKLACSWPTAPKVGSKRFSNSSIKYPALHDLSRPKQTMSRSAYQFSAMQFNATRWEAALEQLRSLLVTRLEPFINATSQQIDPRDGSAVAPAASEEPERSIPSSSSSDPGPPRGLQDPQLNDLFQPNSGNSTNDAVFNDAPWPSIIVAILAAAVFSIMVAMVGGLVQRRIRQRTARRREQQLPAASLVDSGRNGGGRHSGVAPRRSISDLLTDLENQSPAAAGTRPEGVPESPTLTTKPPMVVVNPDEELRLARQESAPGAEGKTSPDGSVRQGGRGGSGGGAASQFWAQPLIGGTATFSPSFFAGRGLNPGRGRSRVRVPMHTVVVDEGGAPSGAQA